MITSKTGICNLAISHLGVGKPISSLTEKSEEAYACLTFYDIALSSTLRDFHWPFATAIVSLALVEEAPEHNEWGYAYAVPSNCLEVRRVLSGLRTDTLETLAPYRLLHGASSLVLYTDQAQAALEYTVLVEDVLRFPPDFILALSFRLAAYIAPRLTAGDPTRLGDRALKLYEYEIRKAMVTAANERRNDLSAESEFVRIRT